jgi:hypothetical protein
MMLCAEKKSLRLAWRFESTHLSLSEPGLLMRGLDTIVGIASRFMSKPGQDGSARSAIALQSVRDDVERFLSLTSQQSAKESLRRTLIAPRLQKDLDHVAILIDGTPEIVLPNGIAFDASGSTYRA